MRNFAELGKTAAGTIWDQGLDAVIPDDPRNKEFADAALQEFERCQQGTPGIIRNVLEGAEIAASSLNVGDYEGILEVLQNADDAAASYLDVAIDRNPRNPKLLSFLAKYFNEKGASSKSTYYHELAQKHATP